jgi:HSP20 family molecular chaperone IbpA
MPVDIDIEGEKADYRDGVLTVSMPNAETARPKRIEINSG